MSDQALKDPANPSGPVAVGKYKIHVDRDLCIGAATCVAIAANTYILDSEAKAIVLQTADQDNDDVQLDAARGCPVAAIIVEDLAGNKVYPN